MQPTCVIFNGPLLRTYSYIAGASMLYVHLGSKLHFTLYTSM